MVKRRVVSEEKREKAAERKKKSRIEGYRNIEMLSDKLTHRTRRQNYQYRESEQARNTAEHRNTSDKLRSQWIPLRDKYMNEIQECADNICVSCGGLFYKKSGQLGDEALTKRTLKIIQMNLTVSRVWLCKTCMKSIKNDTIPKLCLNNGFEFPRIPRILKCLTPLEERLVALRLPFMQIRSLGSDRQSGLFGNVVNVPNDLDLCASAIPRSFDKTQTVQVMLKRRMTGKSNVLYETVRPHVVHEAAKYLINTELYQSEGVVLSEHWQDSSRADVQDFTDDLETKLSNVDKNDESSSDEDDEIEPVNPGTQETMLLPPDNLDEIVVKIAPGEGKSLMSLLRDVNAEVLSFPTIYGGMKRTFKEGLKITYTDIAKSEIRNADRRACKPTKILYSYKLMTLSRVAEAIQVCLRKKKKPDGVSVTAGQLCNQDFVANLIQHDDGFRMLKSIRSSPAYWECQDKKLLAMLRQVNIPAFFMTVSAAETKWTELIRQLYKAKYKKEITTAEISKLTWTERAELIKNDPVTCAQHYDHRFRAFLNNLIKPAGGVFSPQSVIDWYCRYEFQLRGSLHTHMLVWIPDSPKFKGDDTDFKKLTSYIDSHITCERASGEDLEELVKYQIHKHSHTCRKKYRGKTICRFNFPKPPMPETTILCPLAKDFDGLNQAKSDYQQLQDLLVTMGRNFIEVIPFDEFLRQLGWTKQRYIAAIQSSLKNSSIFMKRRTSDIYVNNYNTKILETWKANMDIQFVLDGYACAKYVVNYINKSSGGVGKLLRKANEEIRLGNTNLRDRLRQFGNIFNNFSQISQQEAAIGLLGIPLVNCSRSDIYINTSLPSERTFLIKSQKELEELPENSEDIAASSLIDKYIDRPDELESLCLAEFGAYYDYQKTKPTSQAIPLKTLPGYISRRNKARIIRFRNYGEKVDLQNYFREQLMLYTPWRNETQHLLQKNLEVEYQQKENAIRKERNKYVLGNAVDDFIQNVLEELDEECYDETHATIDPELEFLYEEGVQADFLREIGIDKTNAKIEHILSPKLIDSEKFHVMMRSLNLLQRKMLLHVLHLIKTKQLPFYHFISGGAGVGKTHLILAIVQNLLRYFYKQPGQNLDSTNVLVCAPTGKAAFNVFGMTLHHCWRLPPNQYAGKLANLDESSCNTLRMKLIHVKLIIIDEISMMSVQQLQQFNDRCKQIYQTERDFGGKSILVVGHLRQLPPVCGSFVFTIPKMHSNTTSIPQIHGNYLWEHFSLFELLEIMRQKGDAEFCVALNNMAEGVMTSADIKLLKSREITTTNQPPDRAIRLFKCNADCMEYNITVHARLPGETVVSSAHDRVQGQGTQTQKEQLLQFVKTLSTMNTDGLPQEVSLKVGGLYFVSTNIDVSDGLFNGSTGELKKIVFGVTKQGDRIPLRVFMYFENPIVGANIRSSMKTYQNLNKIDLTWTSIERFTRVLQKTSRNGKLQVVRTQIPLISSNGTTIHKSQGSSMKFVVLSLLRKLTRALIYVGCSRATSSSGLWLDGNFEPPPPPPPDDLVSIEMERLRSKPTPLSLIYFVDLDNTYTKLMFHNVQSLNKHYLDVISDHSFMAADLLAFVEPWTLSSDTFTFPGFEIVQRTDCATRRNSFGSMVFTKSNNVTAMNFNFKDTRPGFFTVTQWMTENKHIVMVYKSPKASKSDFLEYLGKLLNTIKDHEVIVIGDFNINLMELESNGFQTLLNGLGFSSKLPLSSPTTDGGTHLEWCFSNSKFVQAWTYESTFSYHKPICVIWPKLPTHRQNVTVPVLTVQDEAMEVEYSEEAANDIPVHLLEALQIEKITEVQHLMNKCEQIFKVLWEKYGTMTITMQLVDQIQAYLNDNHELLTRCTTILSIQLLSPFADQNEDVRSTQLLPKHFRKYYSAVETTPDGNCFYNAISLNLFGNENFFPMVKLCILFDISKNELGYTLFANANAYTYEGLIQTSLQPNVYANECIIYACSKILKRPIHSYDMDFGRPQYEKTLEGFMLALSDHRYVPHRYLLFDTANAQKTPVCIHHRNMHTGGKKNHFVALLRKNDNAPVFPANQDYYINYRQFGGNVPIY